MAGVKEEDLHPLGPWPKGVNNVAAAEFVPEDQLRSAKNVDIRDDGMPSMRKGFVKRVDATNSHSLWSDKHLSFGIYVDVAELIAVDSGWNKTNLLSGFSDAPVSYAYANDSAYLSNGKITARIDKNRVAHPWGIESPSGDPIVTAISGVGGLSAGDYQVALNFADKYREEGGAGLSTTVTVPEGGGIALADIPQPVAADTTKIRVNVSKTNGDKLYWHRDLPRGTTTYQFGVSQLGRMLKTQLLVPMPPGTCVTLFNTRLYVANGNLLIPSEPYFYGLRNPTIFFRVPGKITMVQPSRWADIGGLYVSAGGVTYFLRGAGPLGSSNTVGFSRVPAYEFGAVPGSDTRVPGSKLGIDGITQDSVPVWMAENGVMCAGLSDGNIVPITEGRLELPQFERGASIFIERPSRRQVLFNLSGIGAPSAAVAGDSVVATVTRNGVTV